MKLMICVNGEEYYSEEMPDTIHDPDVSFKDRVAHNSEMTKLYMMSFSSTFQKVKGRKKNCQLYLVFQSKMNEEL